MSHDPTLEQSGEDRSHARRLSEQRQAPPLQVPGYQAERLLGSGAYGEVWLARAVNTGRQVAIKFYTHRGGVDWSLLSREVEKLAFLFNDRYVVQLLEVGWEADPPYYVMEYMPQGSLEERLAAGPLPVAEAVALWQDVATGLVHAHGRGVLHCDLKPANVMLDHDGRPRLADFGQSRLSHEQAPALGTLFYMAPEQADLAAVPDARWDVYALGALFYALVTGQPPYRSEAGVETLESAVHLEDRLQRYRDLIRTAPRPSGHRRAPGMDRGLQEIADRCLAIDPEQRLPNAQAVLDRLALRQSRRARRPLVTLGAIGPLLLLAVMAAVGWFYFRNLLSQADQALQRQALENNRFAARFVAANIGFALGDRLRAVEQAAADPRVAALLERAEEDKQLQTLIAQLNDPGQGEAALNEERQRFRQEPRVKAIQQWLDGVAAQNRELSAASWFVADATGIHTARAPLGESIGRNYAWRAYHQGGAEDMPKTFRPTPQQHVRAPNLSGAFISESTGAYIIAASAPIERDGKFLGVVAMTVPLGGFTALDAPPSEGGAAAIDPRDRFAVLVDNRPGRKQGWILQHQLYDDLLAQRDATAPGERASPLRQFETLRVRLASKRTVDNDYVDVMSSVEQGDAYRGRWLAAIEPVEIGGRDSGLVVIVQESYDEAIGGTLRELSDSLLTGAGVALALAAFVMSLLWGLVLGAVTGAPRWRFTQRVRRALGLSSDSVGESGARGLTPPPPLE